MKLIQILCKGTCGALIASRRSAALAAPGAAPAAKASRGNTCEDGPNAKPLQQWESKDWTSRTAVQLAQEKPKSLQAFKNKSSFFTLNSSFPLHYQSTNLSFSFPSSLISFSFFFFLETLSYQMSMNSVTLINSVFTNQEFKEKVDFWPTVGDTFQVT